MIIIDNYFQKIIYVMEQNIFKFNLLMLSPLRFWCSLYRFLDKMISKYQFHHLFFLIFRGTREPTKMSKGCRRSPAPQTSFTTKLQRSNICFIYRTRKCFQTQERNNWQLTPIPDRLRFANLPFLFLSLDSHFLFLHIFGYCKKKYIDIFLITFLLIFDAFYITQKRLG